MSLFIHITLNNRLPHHYKKTFEIMSKCLRKNYLYCIYFTAHFFNQLPATELVGQHPLTISAFYDQQDGPMSSQKAFIEGVDLGII